MHPVTEHVKSYLLGPHAQDLSKELGIRLQMKETLLEQAEFYLSHACTVRANRLFVQVAEIGEEISKLEEYDEELKLMDITIASILKQ